MQTVHAALALCFPDATLDRLPIYQHWEDEELGYPRLYEALSIKIAPAGYPAWCTSNREGTAIEGIFSAHHDARHPDGFPWDTLWRWWCHQPPTMRAFSQLRRP